MIERPSGRFTIRPEKIRILSEGDGDGAGDLEIESGTIKQVSYAGMVTRLHVGLDAGGELQVARQNTQTTSQEVEGLPGTAVRVGWHREHAVPVDDQSGNSDNSKEEEER